ncbi:MAG TPA: SPOR domain-containing protein [Terriglobales bacterium]|nr:SPOR domain-containing protein [Terriglobales bacterium]
MAGNGKRGGGDRVLESRHLVGLFLGVVLLCGVFFTLGYVMGRNQFGPVHAEDTDLRKPQPAPVAAKAKQPEPQPAATPNEWDFYGKGMPKDPRPGETPAVATRNNNAPTASAATTKPVAATKEPARFQPPKLGKGSIVLQVSALTRQSDALAMADAIQQKRFPSFVVTPTTDNFYRVQVGPYPDEKSADAAKHALEQAGFKSIIKR